VGIAGAGVTMQVPFMIVISTSRFTDTANSNNPSFGYKVYESPSIFSITFAAIGACRLRKRMTHWPLRTCCASRHSLHSSPAS
jgi:hypothetical protein